MNFLYHKRTAAMLAIIAVTGAACGQNAKIKTITIINGDTTVSEKVIGDKDIADIEKQITMVINENDDASGKKVVKKIIVNGDDSTNENAMAYAYSLGDGKNQDVEISTDDNGTETKIIIKKGKKDNDKSGSGENKTVIRSESSSSTDNGKESMSVNINVTGTLAKVEVNSSSKEPLNISVLDENGKQVFYDSQKTGGKYSKEIKLEKKGTYFMNLIQNKKSSTSKIVIE